MLLGPADRDRPTDPADFKQRTHARPTTIAFRSRSETIQTRFSAIELRREYSTLSTLHVFMGHVHERKEGQ